MEWIAIVTGLALIEYLYFSLQVGRARGQYEIAAPSTTGHPIFERHYRVQVNTLEQLVVFLPALWIFGRYTSENIAAVLGVIFLIGRLIYAVAYVKEPSNRTIGFALGFLATVVLVLGGLYGAVRAIL